MMYQGGNEGVSGIASLLGGSACRSENAPDRSLQGCKSSDNIQKIAQIATKSAGEIGSRVRRCAATARWIARDLAARKAAQVKVRSKFFAKNVEQRSTWVANLSIPSARQRCSRSLARRIVQVKGRRRPTSLSCDYDMLSCTLVCTRCFVGRSTKNALGSHSAQGWTVHVHQKVQLVQTGTWSLRGVRSPRGTALADPGLNVTLDNVCMRG